jgi:hypothetical protein
VSTATAPDTTDLAERRAWAISVFELPADASQQSIRAAVVAHLDQAELVPSANWRQAIRLLCDAEPSSLPKIDYDAFSAERENVLAEEISQFAADFFKLPNVRRRGKWAELSLRAEPYARLRARLAGFQRGLNIVANSSNDSRESLLASRLCQLFVLKPSARETQRRAWLLEMEGDWRRDVRLFRGAHADLASLDQDFLDALMVLENGPIAARKAVAAAQKHFRERGAAEAQTAVAVRRANQVPSKQSSGRGIPIGVVAFAGIMIMNILRTCENSSNRTPNYNYNPPSYNSRNDTPTYNPPRNPPPADGQYPWQQPTPTTPDLSKAANELQREVERKKAADTLAPFEGLPRSPPRKVIIPGLGEPGAAPPRGSPR